MHFIKYPLTFLLLVFYTQVSNANTYVGFSGGVSDVDSLSNGRSVFVYAGYGVSNEFALEAAYYHSGKLENGTLGADFSSRGVIIQLANTIQVHGNISLFGKVGMYIWGASTSSTLNNEDNSFFESENTYGEDVHYTLGASFHILPKHQLTVDYSLVGLDIGSTDVDLKTFSAGWKYTF